MRIRKLTSTGLVTLGVLAGGLALASAPAFGVVIHRYTGQQLSEAPPGTRLQQPWGMVFDSSGNLLLADPGSAVVDEFSFEGVFVRQIGGGVLSGPFNRSVAVDSAGDVYVADSENGSVYVFKPNGELLSTWTNPEFGGGAVFVAVDNSTNLSDKRAGDVYVLELSNLGIGKLLVVKPIEEHAKGEVVGEVPVSGINAADGLAIDSATGNVYVAEPENHAVAVFNDKGEEQPSLAPKGSETPTGSLGFPLAVAVDESTGEVYVVDAQPNKVVDEFSSSGRYEMQITGTSRESPFGEPLGVAVQQHEGAGKGDVYVSDESGVVDIFGPEEVGSAPVLSGERALKIASTSAQLKGEVNPEGSETSFSFSYARGPACTGEGSTTTAGGQAGSGTVSVSKSEVVSELEPSTEYSFCMAAESKFGLPRGPSVPFETLGAAPAVEAGSESTSEVRSSEATLEARINPEKQKSGYYFEASPAALGACPASPAQSGTSLPAVYEEQSASTSLKGLQPGTTYSFRAVAYNATGVSCGPAETFATQPLLLGPSTVSEITQKTATITATIDPGGLETTYELELGMSTGYDTSYAGDAGSGTGPVSIVFPLSRLEAGTTFHFRVIAGNSREMEIGPDQTFTTAASSPGVPPALTAPSSAPFVPFTAIGFPSKTKLELALEACRKLHSKSRRSTCEKRARKRYGAKSRKATPKSKKATHPTGANGRKR